MTTASDTAATSSVLTIAGRASWLTLWGAATGIVGFEILNFGSSPDALILVAVAFGAFILPDLNFLVGVGQPIEKGYLPTRAVPYYNAMHRVWPPLLLAAAVGIGLTPSGPGGAGLLVASLSWLAHVALDRAAGYGLRNPDGSR